MFLISFNLNTRVGKNLVRFMLPIFIIIQKHAYAEGNMIDLWI